MSKTVNITPGEALTLMRDNGLKVEELEALNFRIIASSQVTAAEEVTFEVDEKLVKAAEVLYEAGRKVKPTNAGRERHVLSEGDGLYPYRVSVTKA
jgi:hypothetical protein